MTSGRTWGRRLRSAAQLVLGAAPALAMAVIGTLLVSTAAAVTALLVVPGLVDGAAASRAGAGLGRLAPGLVILATALLVLALASTARRALALPLTERVALYAVDRVLDVTGAASLDVFDLEGFTERVERAQSAHHPAQVTQALLTLAGAGLMLLAAGVALIAFAPGLALALILVDIPTLLTVNELGRGLSRASIRFTLDDRRGAALRRLLCAREPAAEVRAYGLDGFLRERSHWLEQAHLEGLARLAGSGFGRALAANLATALAALATVIALFGFVLYGGVSVGTATAAAAAVLLLPGAVGGFTFGAGLLAETAPFLEDHRALCGLLPVVRGASVDDEPPTTFHSIQVEHVSFTHPGAERPALSDVSLTIDEGEVVAVVGEEGAGKTTLARLLTVLYRPGSGRILWDGTDVATVNAAKLREAIALVTESPARFPFKASECIGLGRLRRIKDHEAIREAARLAGADRFLAALPDGYDTVLGLEEGDISAAQWQKVALARAIFRSAPLLILDDPPLAVERGLAAGMRGLLRGRTVLITSRRFANVEWADRIYVLSEGRVVESGSHAQLLRRGGQYAELFSMQGTARTALEA